MAAGMLHGTCVGEDAGERNFVFFDKVAAVVCEAVAGRSF